MIYEVIWTSRFKQTFKLAQKRGLPVEELMEVVEKLRTLENFELTSWFTNPDNLETHL